MKGLTPTICHLTSVHPRYDVRILLKECISLQKHYNVALVVADGKGDEDYLGIQIYDVGKPQNRLSRIRKTTKQVFQKALDLNAPIYHIHDPELLPIGLKLKKSGKKVIYDAHEDVPRQIMGKPYLNKLAKPIISKSFNWYEDRIARQLDGIITATPFIRDRFLKLHSNTKDINNFPLLGELNCDVTWDKKEKAVCYVGGISKIRGIKEMVQAMEHTQKNVVFHLAGTFKEQNLKNEVSQYDGWTKTKAYGFVDRSMVKNIYVKSMAGLVTLHPIINYLDALPVKMFEYMLAGIPVIASDIRLWKKIIETESCGICVNPMDPPSIAKAIDYLVSNPKIAVKMGTNGKRAVIEKYNWTQEEKKLLQFYYQILSS